MTARVSLMPSDPKLYIAAGGGCSEVQLSPEEKMRVQRCYEKALDALKKLSGIYASIKVDNNGQDLSVENIVGIDATAGIVQIKVNDKIRQIELEGDTSQGFLGALIKIVNAHYKCQALTYVFNSSGKYPIGSNALTAGSGAIEGFKEANSKDDRWKKTDAPKGFLHKLLPTSKTEKFDKVNRELIEKLQDKKNFPYSPGLSDAEKNFKKRMNNAEKLKTAFEDKLKEAIAALEEQKQAIQRELDGKLEEKKDGQKLVEKIAELEKNIAQIEKEISNAADGQAKDRLDELKKSKTQLNEVKQPLAEKEKQKAELEQTLVELENKLNSVNTLDWAALNAVIFTRCHAGVETATQRFHAAEILHSAMVLYLAVYKPLLPQVPGLNFMLRRSDPNGAIEPKDGENYSSLISILSPEEKRYCGKVAAMLLGPMASRNDHMNFAKIASMPYSGKPFEEDFLEALDELEGVKISDNAGSSNNDQIEREEREKLAAKYLGL